MHTYKKHKEGLYFVYTMKKYGTLFALTVLGISVYFVAIQQHQHIATVLWSIALLLLLFSWYDKRQTWQKFSSFLPLLGILILAFVLRSYQLTTLPSFVHGDEAWIGIEAKKIVLSNFHVDMFRLGWYEYPQLTFLLAAIPMKLFGISLFSLRFSSVLLGILSLALCYVIVQTFRNKKEAVVATLLMTCSHLHIHFSRIGTHYMQGLVFIEVSLLFFLLAIKQKRAFLILLAGVCTGLGFHVYLSARITGMIIVVTLFAYGIFCNKKLISWKQFWVFGMGILFGIGPYILSVLSANGRTSEVFLFNNLHHLTSVYGTHQWSAIIFHHILCTVSFLIGGTDKSVQYGIQNAGIDIGTVIACMVGIFLWMRSIKLSHTKKTPDDFSCVFLTCMAVWLGSVLVIGGIATIDAPFYPRLLPSVVPVCVFSAYAICNVLPKKPKRVISILMIGIVGSISIANLYTYFVTYPRLVIYKNAAQYTAIGYVAKTYKDRTLFFVQNDSLSFDYATIQFLAPQTGGITVNTVSEALVKAPPFSVVLVTNTEEYNNVEILQIIYPSYQWNTVYSNTNQPLLYYTEIPREPLLRK